MTAEVDQKSAVPEVPAHSGLEDQLVRLATADATRFVALFKRIRDSHGTEVTRACLRHLGDFGLDAAGSKMQIWLLSNTIYLDLLLDPIFLTDEQAFRVAAIMRDASSQFTYNLQLRITQGGSSCDLKHLSRAVFLTKAFVDPGILIPWLRNLTQHPDEFTRSKAAKLLCELRPNPRMIEAQLKSSDARVRANAVEAAWSMTGTEVVEIFRAAVNDGSHRVVVNALIGLYRLGIDGALEKLLALTWDASEVMRCAAIWGLGFLGDPEAIPTLRRLAGDGSAAIAAQASGVLAKIEPASEKASEVGVAEAAAPVQVETESVPVAERAIAEEQPEVVKEPKRGRPREFEILKI